MTGRRRAQSTGTCSFCGGTFSKSGMGRHLQTCAARDADNRSPERRGQARHMHLVVEGTYNPGYWMHLEMPASSVLGELDYFLRAVWLECCGHLSLFRVGRTNYVSYRPEAVPDWLGQYDEPQEKDMWGARLSSVLNIDSRFSHQYDFGSTTYLKLRVVSERRAKVGDGAVRVLARNEPPERLCDVCDQPAVKVCAYCIWNGAGWLCDDHTGQHSCGEEALLPVVNSPRTGMCGYTGPLAEYSPPTLVI